jgi:hypothetical protein
VPFFSQLVVGRYIVVMVSRKRIDCRAMAITCLVLFGLVTFTAETSTKEMNALPFFTLLLKLLQVQFAPLEWFGIGQSVARLWQPNQSLCLYL